MDIQHFLNVGYLSDVPTFTVPKHNTVKKLEVRSCPICGNRNPQAKALKRLF